MEITQSDYKNLLRLVSKKFEQLVFLNYQHNNVLFELKCVSLHLKIRDSCGGILRA